MHHGDMTVIPNTKIEKCTLSALCKNTNIDLAAAAVKNIPTPQVDVREHVFHLR